MKNTTFTTKRTNAKMLSIALLSLFADSVQALTTVKDNTGRRTTQGNIDGIAVRFVYYPNHYGCLTVSEPMKGRNSVHNNVDNSTIWHFLQKITKKRVKAQKAQALRIAELNSAEKCAERRKAISDNDNNAWTVSLREFPDIPCTVHSMTDKKHKVHDYFAIDCDKIFMQSYTDILNALLIAVQACKSKFCKISANSSVNAPKKWLGHAENLAQAYCRLCAQYNYFAGNKNAEIRIFDKVAKKSIIYRQADYITFVLSSLRDESYDYYSIAIKTLQYMQKVPYIVTQGIKAHTVNVFVPKSYGSRIYNAYRHLNKALEKSRKEYNDTQGSIDDINFMHDIATYCSYIDSTEKSSTAQIVNQIISKYDSTAKLMLSTYGKCKNISGTARSAKGHGIRQCAKMCGITNPNKAQRILKKFESDILAKYPTLKMNAGTIDENILREIEIENAIERYALRKKAVQAKTTAQAVLKMLAW